MSADDHLTAITGNHKGNFTIYYQHGDKVEKLSDCVILKLDEMGVSFNDKVKLGKNRRKFIPTFKLVLIEQEFL